MEDSRVIVRGAAVLYWSSHLLPRSFSDLSAPWADPSADCICDLQVTAVVMLLPVARSFLTFLRKSSIINTIIPFDNNLKFHRFFGYNCK